MAIQQHKAADGVYLYAIADTQAPAEQRDMIIHNGPHTYVWIGDRVEDEERAAGFTYVRCSSLLGIDTSNEKLAKTAKTFEDVLSVIYYGAPFSQASIRGAHAINTCSHASKECARFCLNTAGKGTLRAVQFARVARTRWSVFNPATFWDRFRKELAKYVRKAQRENKRLHCRPNGTTDQRGAELLAIMREFSQVTFYDYSAVPSALDCGLDNYHVTFSRKETRSNLDHCLQARKRGVNIAIVADKEVKAQLLELPGFVDFDKHDLRVPQADGRGVIGVLSPKGRMRGKTTDNGMVYGSVNRVLAELN